VGERFWSDIEVSVACRPGGKGAIGLYLYYRGPEDYALFRWSSADSERPVRQLILREGGRESVLAEKEGGYAPGQWHRVEALACMGWVRLSVDGRDEFLVDDPGLTNGRIGLLVEGTEYATFDDVEVRSRPARLVGARAGHVNGWLSAGGEWMQVARAEWSDGDWAGGIVARAPGRAALLWDDPGWKNTVVSARLGPWRRGALGILFRYGDERNHYCVRWKKASVPVLQVCRTLYGKEEVLAERVMPEDGKAHRLDVSSEEGAISVRVDGRTALETADYAFLGGRAGLYAEGVSGGSFSRVLYGTQLQGKPLGERAAAAFAAEPAEMRTWAGTGSDWRPVTYSEDIPQTATLWWHRAEFRGDTRLDMRLGAPPAAEAEAGLLLDGDGKDILSGYMIRLRAGEVEGERVFAELLAHGGVVRKKELEWAAGPRILSLRRIGDVVSVFLSDRVLFSFSGASRRDGNRIGWYACKLKITPDDVDIYSDNLLNYAFQKAPTDWRSAGGVWEVTNKWECDPRWSFFSGRRLGGPAVIWFRRPLRGDFTLDCYIGNKMARERGQRYEYARDMNISFCANGEDLTSGYSFLFGGHNNERTSLYRKGVEIGRSKVVINRRGLHRKWYHFRVSRTGKRIRVLVDEVPVFDTEDERPLGDGYFAIWTYDNGIMIGRVRISADGLGPLDSPYRVWGAATQSIYN